MRFFIILSCLLGIQLTANSQSDQIAQLEALMDRLEEHQKSMGSLSIYKDGKPFYQRAIGFADVRTAQLPDEQTTYRIGSISKTFTAVLILQLVEEGRLGLDTRLSSFYPKVRNADKITMEHLLRHRSGLFNITNLDDFQNWMEKPQTKAQMLGRVEKLDDVFEPGEKAEYSNTNFILLTWILEDLYQTSYPTILNSRIILPLDLKHTYYGGKINPENNEAFSFDYFESWKPSTESDMSVPGGAGGLVSTPGDLNRFLSALFSGDLIKRKTLDQMIEMVDGFGMGMFAFPFYEKTAYGHTGGIDAFQSIATYFPEEKLSVAYTANGVVYPNNDLLIDVLSICFGMDYEPPTFLPSLLLEIDELEPLVGTYTSTEIPLEIIISRENRTLIAQATGQSAFPLEALEAHVFRFEPAGIKLEFDPEIQGMTLLQAGMEIPFTKK